MNPYYDRGGITIYHGDCREILPSLGRFDLLLTDPPYGIGEDGGRFRDRAGGGHRVLPRLGRDNETPTAADFAAALAASSAATIWGGNYFTDKLPVSRGWLYWDKRMGGDFSDGELAWTSRDAVLRSYSKCNKLHGKKHPTEKPVSLMSWCLGFFPEAKTVVDPYMGSGPVAKACKDRGLRYVGIELVEQYCEIAVKRLAQEVLFA